MRSRPPLDREKSMDDFTRIKRESTFIAGGKDIFLLILDEVIDIEIIRHVSGHGISAELSEFEFSILHNRHEDFHAARRGHHASLCILFTPSWWSWPS